MHRHHENPCSEKPPVNTAACEVLSSQVENFTLNFFGEIFKTEVNGVVQWSLPCRLDVGLSGNPRGSTEPLGCYFLRLFRDGVVGAKGAKGDPGLIGCNGSTPYVQVLIAFGQPALNVVFPILVTKNPSILPGMDVFIEGSGWYEIIKSDGLGHVTVALRKAVVNPQGLITVGTVLLPSGKVGAQGSQGVPGIVGRDGAKGLTGLTGPQGLTGAAGSLANANLPLTAALLPPLNVTPFPPSFDAQTHGWEGGFTPSGFVNIILFPGALPASVTLLTAGTYLVMARVVAADVTATGAFSIIDFRLKNISANTVVPQSTIRISRSGRLTTFVSTLAANNTVQLQAQSLVGSGTVSVNYLWAFKIS